jgi:hypothetical protein
LPKSGVKTVGLCEKWPKHAVLSTVFERLSRGRSGDSSADELRRMPRASRCSLGQHSLSHGLGAGDGQLFSVLPQLLDFFTHQNTQLVIGGLLVPAMTDATPRKKVWTVAHMKVVLFIPPHES